MCESDIDHSVNKNLRKITSTVSLKLKGLMNKLLQVLHELSQRCPNLTHLLLDFSHGAQLADFSGLSAFPTKIRFRNHGF